jgi:hypothetical protein
MEHDEQAERLEREVEDMEKRSGALGEQIEETRRDWKAKEDDPAISGAQPDPADDKEEDTMSETPQESDQLPEEAPEGQVPDDSSGPSRPEADDTSGAADDEGTATGNPDAAGSDE